MKEKFIYPLLAILLTVISTNVSAVTAPANKPSSKPSVFIWQGFIPAINAPFDWELVDRFGNPYTPKTADLTPKQNIASGNLEIVGAPIEFFIAPKYHDSQTSGTNVINEVTAKLMQRPTPDGFTNNNDIVIAENAVPGENQVAIIINGFLATENDMIVNKIGSNPSLFEVSIRLEAKIPSGNYTVGSSIGFTVPIMFTVDLNQKNVSPP